MQFVQQIVNGIMLGIVYGLFAVGLTLVYAVLKFVNLAHGEMVMVGAYIGYFVAVATNNVLLAFLASIAGMVFLGVIIERCLLRPVRLAHHFTPLLITFGLALIFTELVKMYVFGGFPVIYPENIRKPITLSIGPISITTLQITTLIVGIFLMMGLGFLIYKTKLGKAMRSVAENMETAALLGVNANRIARLTFGLASALCAAAGVFIGVLYPYIHPHMGAPLAFKAFAIILFAGAGNVFGAICGGIFLGLVESIAVGFGLTLWRDVFTFVIIIVILLLKPTGIFGTPYPETR